MDRFIEMFAGGRETPRVSGAGGSPTCGRFLALLIIVFVAQNHSRPIRQGQAEEHPRLADVQMKVAAETLWEITLWSRQVTTSVIVIFSVLLPPGMDEP